MATVMDRYPEKPVNKYRTKCFANEQIRIESYRAMIRRNRSNSNRGSKDSIKDYDGADLYKDDFKVKAAEIPYAVKTQRVTA